MDNKNRTVGSSVNEDAPIQQSLASFFELLNTAQVLPELSISESTFLQKCTIIIHNWLVHKRESIANQASSTEDSQSPTFNTTRPSEASGHKRTLSDEIPTIMDSMLTDATRYAQRYVQRTHDRTQLSLEDPLASMLAEDEGSPASSLFRALRSSLPKVNSDAAIQTFLSGIEKEIGFNPLAEPERLQYIMSNLQPPSSDSGVSSPSFWTNFVRYAIATVISLLKLKRRDLELNSDELTEYFIAIFSVILMAMRTVMGVRFASVERYEPLLNKMVQRFEDTKPIPILDKLVDRIEESNSSVEALTKDALESIRSAREENARMKDENKTTTTKALEVAAEVEKMKTEMNQHLKAALDLRVEGIQSTSDTEAILEDLKVSTLQAEEYLIELKALKDVSSQDFLSKWNEFEFWKGEIVKNVTDLKIEHAALIEGQTAQHEKALAEEKRKWEEEKKKYKDEVDKLSLLLTERSQKGDLKALMMEVEEKAKQIGLKLKASTDKATIAAIEDVLIEFNTSISTLGKKVQGLEDSAIAEAYSRLQAGFINLRHLQTTIREDFCAILNKSFGDKLSRYEEYIRTEKSLMDKADKARTAAAIKAGIELDNSSDETRWNKNRGNKYNLKERCDIALFEKVKKEINESNDPRYDGYRGLLNVTGEQRVKLLAYLFDPKSATHLDGNFFAHSFLPHFTLYRDAIVEFSPTEETQLALDSLAAMELFIPVEARAARKPWDAVKYERVPRAVSTVAKEGVKNLKDRLKADGTTTTQGNPATPATVLIDPVTAGTPAEPGTPVAASVPGASRNNQLPRSFPTRRDAPISADAQFRRNTSGSNLPNSPPANSSRTDSNPNNINWTKNKPR